ncbi:MAG: hypothetical protein WKF84_13605 [Pyrinomonadaceae bacterium]
MNRAINCDHRQVVPLKRQISSRSNGSRCSAGNLARYVTLSSSISQTGNPDAAASAPVNILPAIEAMAACQVDT